MDRRTREGKRHILLLPGPLLSVLAVPSGGAPVRFMAPVDRGPCALLVLPRNSEVVEHAVQVHIHGPPNDDINVLRYGPPNDDINVLRCVRSKWGPGHA